MSLHDKLTGEAIESELDGIETTSVDGRSYVSISDLVGFLLKNAEANLLVADILNIDTPKTVQEVHAAARLSASLDDIELYVKLLFALRDREGLESLAPGDFL